MEGWELEPADWRQAGGGEEQKRHLYGVANLGYREKAGVRETPQEPTTMTPTKTSSSGEEGA